MQDTFDFVQLSVTNGTASELRSTNSSIVSDQTGNCVSLRLSFLSLIQTNLAVFCNMHCSNGLLGLE